MTSLFGYGPGILSRPGNGTTPSGYPVASLSVGTEVSGHPATNVNSGDMGLYAEANEVTASFALDMGTAVTPDVVGFFNQNWTGTVRVQASASNTFGTLIVDALVTLGDPHAWADLRSVSPRTARYWRVQVTGNAEHVTLGEFVLATVTAVRGYQWGYEEAPRYLERTLGASEYGLYSRVKRGVTARLLDKVRWSVFESDAPTLFRRITDAVGYHPTPVLFVPDDTGTDVWLLHWAAQVGRKTVTENWAEMELTLEEQSPGGTGV